MQSGIQLRDREALDDYISFINRIEFLSENFYCGIIGKWVVADMKKCISCNRDGVEPKCYVSGGRTK